MHFSITNNDTIYAYKSPKNALLYLGQLRRQNAPKIAVAQQHQRERLSRCEDGRRRRRLDVTHYSHCLLVVVYCAYVDGFLVDDGCLAATLPHKTILVPPTHTRRHKYTFTAFLTCANGRTIPSTRVSSGSLPLPIRPGNSTATTSVKGTTK